jgi:recombination protein RecT
MTVFEEFKKNLQEVRADFEKLLGGDTDKFIQVASNFVEQHSKLLEANKASLYKAITDAAQCRLFLDGQEASLVPFKGTVKMMTGYKGILKMVRNSGELASINAGVVYEADTFEYFVDENGEHIKHIPKFVKERGKPVQTYCVARTKGSDVPPYIEVMTEDEIQACKKASRAGDDSPWNGPFVDEMRKKTVMRRISKRLPMSTDLNTALHSDDDLFVPPADGEDAAPAPEKTTSSRLAGAVGAAAPAPAPSATPAPAPAPTPAPISAPAPEKAEYVEGLIVETKIVQVTKDGKKTDRFACRVGETQWYGTFERNIYDAMNAAKDKKVNCWVIYQDKLNANKQAYKECLDVKEMPIAEDDVLI